MTTKPDLDLDAMEREQEIIAKYPWWRSDSETPQPDPHKVLALIQRLRETRGELKRTEEYVQILERQIERTAFIEEYRP
jgi:hypothetical protein